MIYRALYDLISDSFSKQKVTLLLGARRVGKTELLTALKDELGQHCLWLNGEDANVLALLEERSVANYRRLLQNVSILIIDEAQFVPEMGLKAKLMIDHIKPLHIILTGSSAFDIAEMGEPLAGRTIRFYMYPLAQLELESSETFLQTKEKLEERLIYGSYPELVMMNTLTEKKTYLLELVNTYLLKDILAFENVRNAQKLKDLLQLLAYQVGQQVSLEELGRQLALSKNTVERYLDLLCKVFVIYKRNGFSRNLRKEIVKTSRYYFTDNGILNAVIGQFAPLSLREDVGRLWENYLLSERNKCHEYSQTPVDSYFWRTYDGQEIDLIEVANGQLHAIECKWKKPSPRPPIAFAKAYPEAIYESAHQGNYLHLIVPEKDKPVA